jgi:hypothetical protein
MTNFTIDKGVAHTPSNAHRRLYPWYDMGVGDSFFVPVPEGSDAHTERNLRATIYNSGRNMLAHRDGDYTLSVRKVVENGVVGLRSWLLDADGIAGPHASMGKLVDYGDIHG